MKNKKSIIILNKMDLEQDNAVKEKLKNIFKNVNIIEISAKNSDGIEKIYDEIERLFKLDEIKLDNSTIITNVRHKNIINNAINLTKKAIEINEQNLPIDMIGLYIKNIMEELGKITGESVSDEIINEIFAKFCLGK